MHRITTEEFAARYRRRGLLTQTQQEELDGYMLIAAFRGHRMEVESYMKEGAHPDAADVKGDTGLFMATEVGCILTLLEGKANPLLVNKQGVLPMIHHIAIGNAPVVGILSENMPANILANVRGAAMEACFKAPRSGPCSVGEEAKDLVRRIYRRFDGPQTRRAYG